MAVFEPPARAPRFAGRLALSCQSDERLVALTRAGHDRAFEAIVERYRAPLLRHCRKLLPEGGRAEDAVQQAFLNAYRGLRRTDGEIRLRPWLHRIAHNAALDALRESGWQHDQVPESHDGVERPEQVLERRESLGSVVSAVNALPERQRDAIVLQAVEGRSYEEIATTLDLPLGTVKTYIHRARHELRRALEPLRED